MRKNGCLVMVYNSFGDPLFRNIILPYVKTLASQSRWCFHVITFEQPEYNIPEHQKVLIQEDLGLLNIVWYPKRHHTGNMLLLKKVYDFFSISFLVFKLRVRNVKVIWSFANVAASIAWVYARLLGMKTIVYSYEPHSDFMVELGIWERQSLKYRLLQFLEYRVGIQSDYVMTGTQHMVHELGLRKTKAKVYLAPTSVDENDFYYRHGARNRLSNQHGFKEHEKIILYIGKFGGLYYTWEIAQLFKTISEQVLNARFVIVSSNPSEEIGHYFAQVDFDFNRIVYRSRIPDEEVKIYMSGADLGVSAVPPSPSQKYRSPTKVAEYLLCGLPFITTLGVSEDDSVVEKFDVGVVLKDYSEKSIKEAIPKIMEILLQDKDEMVKRCRSVGLAYRAKSNADLLLAGIFNELES